MGDLGEYRRKRDPRRTPEPIPDGDDLPHGNDDTFVIQEHHARSLHWDVRFEREGVLASWAVPKGLPPEDSDAVRLAVHTEDHPLAYAEFEGEIPKGEYGAGTMTIWDRGRYVTHKWSPTELDVELHGSRVSGRFVFLRRDSGWLVRRRSAAHQPSSAPRSKRVPTPEFLPPMLATPGTMPPAEHDDDWAYEFKWDGVRAIVRVEGGRVRAYSRVGNEITSTYPELAGLGEQLGTTEALLDGEIVAFSAGRPSFGALQRRMHVNTAAQARRLMPSTPVTYLVFDLLHLDGTPSTGLPYRTRRQLLERLDLKGPHWQTPRAYPGSGAAVLAASREQRLEGVVAKRLTAPYLPGQRSADWVKVTEVRAQEAVIGGWRPGEGKRAGVLGALLLGIPGEDGLSFAGSVGTGFNDAELTALTARLRGLSRATSPFVEVPRDRARGAQWVTPTLVGEVVFTEWTGDGRMRNPRWRGLRLDKRPEEVRRLG